MFQPTFQYIIARGLRYIFRILRRRSVTLHNTWVNDTKNFKSIQRRDGTLSVYIRYFRTFSVPIRPLKATKKFLELPGRLVSTSICKVSSFGLIRVKLAPFSLLPRHLLPGMLFYQHEVSRSGDSLNKKVSFSPYRSYFNTGTCDE